MRLPILALLLTLLGVTQVFSQVRVLGYFPSYRAVSVLDGHYSEVTDIVYSFINAETNGNLIQNNPGDQLYGFDLNKFIQIKDKCALNGVDLWISLAGADPGELRSARMNTICGNSTARMNLATQLVDFAVLHGCHGISVDWEFPKTASARNNHVAFLEDLETRIAASTNTNLLVSIAVGGEYSGTVNHINYVHNDLFTTKAHLVDDWHLMTYDLPASYNTNHSTLADGQGAMNVYGIKGVPKAKMYLGVPFYGRNAARTQDIRYNELGCTATQFNSDQAVSGGVTYYYNGIATIKAKIDAVVNEQAAGIVIWDLGQDCSGSNSFLTEIKSYVDALCPIPDPNMGPDKGVCAPNTETLDPGVGTSAGRTFKWYKDNVVISGQTGTTYTTGNPGTYKVEITEACGVKTDEIKIVTGSSVSVNSSSACANTNLTLTVSNPLVGKEYAWYDQATSGGKLYTGTSYTAQYATTSTVYVEEQEAGVVDYEVAPSIPPAGGNFGTSTYDLADKLIVETDLTIKGARIYYSTKDGATFKIKILGTTIVGTENQVIEESVEFSYAGDGTSPPWINTTQDIVLDFQLPPGTYFVWADISAGRITYTMMD